MGHRFKALVISALIVLVGIGLGVMVLFDLRHDPCRERDGSVVSYDIKWRATLNTSVTSTSNLEVTTVPPCECVGKEFMETLGAMCVERHQWEK